MLKILKPIKKLKSFDGLDLSGELLLTLTMILRGDWASKPWKSWKYLRRTGTRYKIYDFDLIDQGTVNMMTEWLGTPLDTWRCSAK